MEPFESGLEANLARLAELRARMDEEITSRPDYSVETNLQLGLEMAVAYVKNYELDKAEELFNQLEKPVIDWGLPYSVKWLQDKATLRCKQNRQAEALILLEQLAGQVPPNVPTYVNLGTVCNQLGLHERALDYFQKSIDLKGGEMDRDDKWQIGLVQKNLGHLDEARQLLEDALALYLKEVGQRDPIMVAKVYDSVGSCCNQQGDFKKGFAHFANAYGLFSSTVGDTSPLTGWAAQGAADALLGAEDFPQAQWYLKRAFEVEATKDGIHTTPLHQLLEKITQLHSKQLASGAADKGLTQYHSWMELALKNLEKRGLADDGNAGIVMHQMGQIYIFSGPKHFSRAIELLERALGLLNAVHEVDLSEMCAIIEMELQLLRSQK